MALTIISVNLRLLKLAAGAPISSTARANALSDCLHTLSHSPSGAKALACNDVGSHNAAACLYAGLPSGALAAAIAVPIAVAVLAAGLLAAWCFRQKHETGDKSLGGKSLELAPAVMFKDVEADLPSARPSNGSDTSRRPDQVFISTAPVQVRNARCARDMLAELGAP